MYPKTVSPEIDFEPAAVSVIDHDRRVELKVRPTFAVEHPGGGRELIRLRTGTGGTGRHDAAIIHAGMAPGEYFIDAMLAAGSAEEVVSPSEPDRLIGTLLDAVVTNDPASKLRPGVHCISCASAPRCGQYPIAGEGRVFNSTRSITLAKTHLDWLGTCQRRVSWDRVYQIPRHQEDDLEMSSNLRAGIGFHEMAAAAIMADSPDEVVAATLSQAAPDSVSDLSLLWGHHQELWQSERLEARRVEFWLGLTVMTPGLRVDSRGRESNEPVAVSLVGSVDVTGREADGTPMVVEHRTGNAGSHASLEAELYAVGAAIAIAGRGGAWPEAIAVHLHHLRPDPPECRRRLFDREELASALDRLRQAAATAAAWHPQDSLAAPFEVGPWCGSCSHRQRCEGFR